MLKDKNYYKGFIFLFSMEREVGERVSSRTGNWNSPENHSGLVDYLYEKGVPAEIIGEETTRDQFVAGQFRGLDFRVKFLINSDDFWDTKSLLQLDEKYNPSFGVEYDTRDSIELFSLILQYRPVYVE